MSEYTYLVSPDFAPGVVPEGYIWDETAFAELVKATDKATAAETIYTYGGPQGGAEVDYLNAADLTISNVKYDGGGEVVETTVTANAFNNTGTVTTDGAIVFSVKSFTNFGEFNLDKNGALTATSAVTNTADGTINLNAGSTLQGSTVVNGGAITVVSDHATIEGAITNTGTIDALMKKLIVTGDIQNANKDDARIVRNASVIKARELEVTGNVLNYGAIGGESIPVNTMTVSGSLSTYNYLKATILTADSIRNDSIQSEVEGEGSRGFIDAGEINAGSVDNVSGIIMTGTSKETGVGLNVTGTINNGSAEIVVPAKINVGTNGWIKAASINNIGTDIENSLITAGKITVSDIVNNGGFSTRIIESSGTITNNATGLFAVIYIDDPIVTGFVEGASINAGTIINGGTFAVYSEAALPTPVSVTSFENSGMLLFSGAGMTLTGDIVNNADGQFDVAGTVTGTTATITNSGTLSVSNADEISGVLTAGTITNTATGTINLGADSTLTGATVVNGGTITVASGHAALNGAISNHSLIDSVMKTLNVTGDIQNANEDDMREARNSSIIKVRNLNVTGNVTNYGVIGTEFQEANDITISGDLRNFHQIIVKTTLTADSVYQDYIDSEVEEKRCVGYIICGQVIAGEINNASGEISAGADKDAGIAIQATGKITNGKADALFTATLQAGDDGWIQAVDALNNIGAGSTVHAGYITVLKGTEAGDLTNDGIIQTKSITVDGSVTNSATGSIEIDGASTEPGNLSGTSIGNAGTLNLNGNVTLSGDVDNSNLLNFQGTVTATGSITNAETGTINIKSAGSIADNGTITNSGTLHIAIQSGNETKITADKFYNTEGVGKITIGGSCDDGIVIVVSAKDGDVKVSDITLSVTSKSGAEVTAATVGGNIVLVSGVEFDYSTLYLSNGIDENADFGKTVEDSQKNSYYVEFTAFRHPASALEYGVKDTTTTILIDGTDRTALKYESETTASIDGLAFAKDGTNAATPEDEEKNVEFVLTGMDQADPESYRDLKKGITVEEGVTLTADKLRQTGEDAVTTINGELRMGTINPGAKAVVAIDSFEVEAGHVNVNDGGALYDCTVLTGASVTVFEGGYAEDVTAENGGCLEVCEGGAASAVTVDFGGDLYVSDGGKAIRVMENGGYVNFDEGDAEVTFVSNSFSGLTLYGLNWATVHSGTTATDTTVNSRAMLLVFSGGLANNTTVNSNGRAHVDNGGTVNGVVVNSSGEFVVSRGGTATGINVSAGGSLGLVVAPDTYAQGEYAGSAFEMKDGAISDYTVNSGCWLGASAGGVASNATVADGGKLYTLDGGIAIAPTVDVGGALSLYEGGSSLQIKENGGAVYGQITENVTFASNTFSGVVLDGWREATVHSGTTATDTTINDEGCMYVFDGGIASTVVVNREGTLSVKDGGHASDATVNVGGEILVSSGGTATKIKENGGYVEFEDGANVSFVSNTISGLVLNEYEYATLHSGTTATDVKVNSECELEVFSGGVASDVAINEGSLLIYDGGIANLVTVYDKGGLAITSGGMATGVTVNAGGTAEVSSGVIEGAVVDAGGSLLVYSGAKLTGWMTFKNGAEVIPFVGSILDFDLTQTVAGANALVNDLSILMGKPSYTLTVDGNELKGNYKLAGGATGFKETITVVNTFGEELGTFTVGADLAINGKIYTLALNGSDLSVTVDPSNKPDDGTNDFLYDKKNGIWNDANITVENWISASSLAQDDTVYLDVPGTIDQLGVLHNMVGYNTPDPDTGDTARIFVHAPAKLTFQIDSTVAGTFYVYEKVYDAKKGAYKQVQVGKVSVRKDRPAYLKDVCLTVDGDYFVQMAANSSAYKKVGADGYYNVKISSATFFDDVDNGWNDSYAKPPVQLEPVGIGRDTPFVALDSNVESAGDWNFVGGITDTADYARINLESSAFLSFNVFGDDAASDGTAKFTVWRFDGTKGLKKVTSVTLKDGKYTQTTKGVFLDKDEEYYISMESTDAAKGKDVYYKVEVNTPGTRFFDSADDNRNNVLYDKTHKTVYGEDKAHHFVVNEVSAASSAFALDDNAIGLEGFENFVGYGDKVDYAKFTVNDKGKLTFTITATESATFEVWTLNNGKLKSLGKSKLKKNGTIYEGEVSNLSLDVDKEYYVSMTATKTTANTKGSVFYNVSATLTPQNASSLAMPETADALAMTDSLSFGQYNVDALADASASALADLDDKSAWQALTLA